MAKKKAANASTRSAAGRRSAKGSSPARLKAMPAARTAASGAAGAPMPASRSWTYGVHPAVAHNLSIIENMPAKTGKSLEQWIGALRRGGPKGDEKAQIEWLKGRAVGHTSACIIVERAADRLEPWCGESEYLAEAVRFVDAMFAGKKAWMRPLFDLLMEASLGLGADVRACPCQTMVPIYRGHVIAQIKPGTISRLDFGLALGDTKASGRLIDTGGFAKKDRITHRIEVREAADVGEELKKWLRAAYDRDA